MNTRDILSGIAILMPYYDKPDGYHIGAEHDILYLFATDRPVSAEDIEKLIALGWFQEGAEHDEDGEFRAKHYDPEESWACFP